ncbi:MAG: family 20 glycosylhydrolase, partial [Candidatus Hydrogenedentes bacterium]|nr:family 20 glycosylhydrolase [Candidatus Hydrogenedentota bacterium]
MNRHMLACGVVLLAIAAVFLGCATIERAEVTQTMVKTTPATPGDWLLLPAPREMEIAGTIPRGHIRASVAAINELPCGLSVALSAWMDLNREELTPHLPLLTLEASIDPLRVPQAQGYELSIIAPDAQGQGGAVSVLAHDEPGLFYAAQTSKQIVALALESGALPICHIRDWPDFPHRGIMLDIARDKVPEMKTLFELVDLCASWKCNQIQLYTEHTFAYKGHHVVWQDASPMTAEQVRALDQYCKDRYIELVPNQNSFGHMGRWLQHPEYADLAETPGGSDLCPIDPGSLELLRGMYSFMLPNFSSAQFNVGCDETWSLGKGRSKADTDARGVGRVYLEFLLKIRGLVQENGKTMQFWADIINNHPELIPELPKDVVAMEWGYEANHPFAEHAQRFQENGVRFYVVPGTSSWNSLLGRTENALGNLRNAAENGIQFGGEGFLVTDWGDGGHWQFLPVSLLPFAYGAGVSWCYETNKDADAAAVASRYAFQDSAGIMGQIAYDLGNAYKRTGGEYGNSTTFYRLLQHAVEKPLGEAGLGDLKPEDLEATVSYLDDTLARLDQTQMQRPDAELIKAEFRMNATMAKLACRLGAARLRAGGVASSALPKDVRAPLAAELGALLDDYRQLWLARNRSGGLKDS